MAQKPTEEQINEAVLSYIGSDMIDNVAIPQEVRFQLAQTKEHLIVYMWEHFIKAELYKLELLGIEPTDILEVYSGADLLDMFAHYQVGYWETANKS